MPELIIIGMTTSLLERHNVLFCYWCPCITVAAFTFERIASCNMVDISVFILPPVVFNRALHL